MPSPCAPSRSILTSSFMMGADQHFLVAAAAWDRGGHLGEHLPSWLRVYEGAYRPHCLSASLGIADNAALADALAAHLELRLHQGDKPGTGRCEVKRCRQCFGQADEADIGHDSRHGASDDRSIDTPCIGLLQHHDPWIVAELGMQLVPADIHGEHAGSPALEQNLSEAAGRGANVKRDGALRVEAEGVKPGGELESATRDEGTSVVLQREARVGME